MEAIGKSIIEMLPIIAVFAAYQVLIRYLYLPVAFGISVVAIYLVGYCRSNGPKRGFLARMGIAILMGAFTFVLMHYLGKLGWIDVDRA